jgi:hypothetical protein
MSLNRMSNREKSLLSILNLMKSAITNNALYCIITRTSSNRTVLLQATSSTSVFMPPPHMSNTITKHEGIIFCDTFLSEIADSPTSTQAILRTTTVKRSPNFQLLRPFFGWMSADILQKTFEQMSHVILCIRTSPLFSMVLPQLLSSLVLHPRPWLYTVLSAITSLQTSLKIPLYSKGFSIAYLATEVRPSSAIKSKISNEHSVSTNDKVNQIRTTKILRNDDTRPLRMLLTVFLIVLEHLHTYGLLCLHFVCYLLNHMTIDAVLLTKLLGSTLDISPLFASTSGTVSITSNQKCPSFMTAKKALATL